MTSSDTQEIRASRDGDPCPAWCDVDHHTRSSAVPIHIGHVSAPAAWNAYVQLVAHPWAARPEVWATTVHGYAAVSLHQAGDLARLLEELADVEPARLREMAAEVRAAAATAQAEL